MIRRLALALLIPATVFAADTEREQPVSAGERLELRNYDGEVTVTASADDTLRVFVQHAPHDGIVMEQRGSTWLVVPKLWAKDSDGFAVKLPHMARVVVSNDEIPPERASFRVEVPDWMPVLVESPRADVSISDVLAPVEVTTMLGDIEVKGGRDRVHLQTMNGRVELTGARGRLTVETTINQVTVRDCTGDISVETTGGGVQLADLDAESVEVQTLRGDIDYAGKVPATARWDLETHDGDVDLRLAQPVDARFDLQAFRGSIDFALAEAPEEERRVQITVGRGEARVNGQTFSGRIVVRPR